MRTLHDVRDEMLAVAQGTRPVPPVRSVTDGEAVSGLLGVLTPANRALMHLIATERPETVSRLAQLADRAQPNVSRALQDLAKHGLVRLVRDGMSIRPELVAAEIDVDLVRGTCRVVPMAAAAE
ncbi:MarR family transcriptional regulator [Azospirillum melinis]|uniref:MarR family transcriptional regulator n=1 Tax=Azospirillum melinis TaxID=328839 RepID=A0ABX2KLR3_9PROT|nr:MarR family transcriptional regulator [Azospirillum melinis]MBP2310713.1 putative transcriptional regulator [Azospirillum melinis]NUB04535.1 MarR family transcriptional regulator [Azospirillum melinis]